MLRSAEYDFPEVKIDPKMIEIAGTIMERQEGRFEPAQFVDRYQEALRELIKAKAAGQGITKAKAPVIQGNVVDLMDALRRSLAPGKAGADKSRGEKPEVDKPAAEKNASKAKRPAKADKRQAALLLPIKGNKTTPEAPAKRKAARLGATVRAPQLPHYCQGGRDSLPCRAAHPPADRPRSSGPTSTSVRRLLMSIIAWIVLGLIAGFIASKIVNKQGSGIIVDIILGIIGAISSAGSSSRNSAPRR